MTSPSQIYAVNSKYISTKNTNELYYYLKEQSKKWTTRLLE